MEKLRKLHWKNTEHWEGTLKSNAEITAKLLFKILLKLFLKNFNLWIIL